MFYITPKYENGQWLDQKKSLRQVWNDMFCSSPNETKQTKTGLWLLVAKKVKIVQQCFCNYKMAAKETEEPKIRIHIIVT